ncbi:MAG TPA: SH3 domain-containing protein, partial [Mesorhizobium sp.]
AIPAVKPAPSVDDAVDDTAEDKADSAPAGPSSDAKAAQGHIVHGVTMRAAPKKGAAAMTTIPAKTAVQVLNCAQWCQVVYNGKRGWVYKSFVTRD